MRASGADEDSLPEPPRAGADQLEAVRGSGVAVRLLAATLAELDVDQLVAQITKTNVKNSTT